MLVLSRKIGESIEIAGGIRVTVTEVRGGRVRLSIQAPPEIRVFRKEILDAAANASSVKGESLDGASS
ncbi:MAG: carbon storage regulator [Planctomycetota bacterium]